MRISLLFITAVGFIIFPTLFACSTKVSEGMVQTAIAQTRIAEPTPTKTPVPSPTFPLSPTTPPTPWIVTATPPPTPTQPPIIQTQQIGPIWNTTRDESYTMEVTLKSVRWSLTGDRYSQPRSGNTYVIVTVAVKNLGPSPSRYVGLDDFKALDANGRLLDDDYETIIKDCRFETVDLIPGGNAEGCFLFEVPESGKVELIYAPYKYEGLKPGRHLSFSLGSLPSSWR
jgi:hypothetical protein